MTIGTSMYGFNPYMMNTGLNADFMSTATANPYANSYTDPYSQLAIQPTTDTFQKSESSSGLNSGLKLAGLGGVGAGAGAYFFGDKLGITLTKDGKTFSDDILKAFQKAPEEVATTNVVSEISKQQETILKKHGYENMEAFVTASQNPKITQKEAQKILQAQQELGNIKAGDIAKKALADAQKGNLAFQQENLANLAKRKSLIEGLAKDATPAQIEELITKNPTVFGIEKTAEADIAQEAKKIVQKLGTDKTTVVNTITNDIKAVETNVGNLRTTLNGQVAAHWDDAAKAFRESAPDTLKNASKSFKWAKAGKYAAIAAGAGLVLGWMFGGNKS